MGEPLKCLDCGEKWEGVIRQCPTCSGRMVATYVPRQPKHDNLK